MKLLWCGHLARYLYAVIWQNIQKNRDDWIRTSGPFVPNEVRYQAAPHPATKMAS